MVGVLLDPEPNIPTTVWRDERWPAVGHALRQAQDIMPAIDPPRIPEHAPHLYLEAIHAMGTYYPTRHRKASNLFSQLIRKCKEGNRGALDTLCFLVGDFLASSIGTLMPIDLILHVPTDPQRRKERGFSIPEALATAASRRLGIPISDCLVLTRPVRSLRGLPAEERGAELIDAFALSNPARIGKKRILLVDDVIAYQTTTAEIASLLRANGAQGVSVAGAAYAARS